MGNYFLNQLEIQMALDFVSFNRIADAIIPLANEPDPYPYLKRLLSDTLDLFKRQESDAKNILWELEVWSKLKRERSNAYLQEPDLMVDLGNAKLSIACKKIYSRNNVTTQVHPTGDHALVQSR